MSASVCLTPEVTLKSMDDPHKHTRGQLLGAWLKSHGGATACLVATGFERGTLAFKSRESHISQCKREGMGHVAALRFEQEFESIGMTPGTLTNNLEEVGDRQASTARVGAAATPPAPAPVVMNAALVMDLADLAQAVSLPRFLTVVAPNDLPPVTLAGFDVRVDTTLQAPRSGQLVVAKSSAGEAYLGVYQAVVDGGFELHAGRGLVLDKKRHGLTVIGVAIATSCELIKRRSSP
jgi:hypothetical protein